MISTGRTWRKTISTDEVIKAARIRYEKEGIIEVVIEDEDGSNLGGRFEIKLEELKVGLNEKNFEKPD